VVEPVAETHRHSRIVDQHLSDVPAADQDRRQVGWRAAESGRGALDQGLHAKRRQRCLLGGLPDHGVTANQRKRGVPRPDRHGKIESRDNADRSDRMPLLHHPVVRAFAGNGETMELAGETDCKVADVDHLLDLAEALGQDFASFDGDEMAESGLRGTQLLAENPNELPAPGRRKRSPCQECLPGASDRFGDPIGIRFFDVGNGLAGQRRAHDAFAALILIAMNAKTLEN
jgi:hypothetical protein